MINITIEDRIDQLQLSVRSTNALKNAGILTVGDMLEYPMDDYGSIRSMGVKSVAEVKEFVSSLKNGTNERFRLMGLTAAQTKVDDIVSTERDARIAKELQDLYGEDLSGWLRAIVEAKEDHDSENDGVYLFWIYKSKVLRNAVKDAVIKYISEVSECSIHAVSEICPAHLHNTSIPNEIITEMEAEGSIAFSGDTIELAFPSVLSFVKTIEKERTRDALVARLNGATLDEIGQRYDLTRERVRQILEKALSRRPRLAEDKYIYLYDHYDFSLEDFLLAFGEREYVYHYLEIVSSMPRAKRRPILELLTDENVSVALRKMAERAVYKEFVTVDGERVRKRRNDLVEFMIRTRCRNLTKFDDFVEMYYSLLQSLGLSEEPAFLLDEGTLKNKLPLADYVLWNHHQSFRYYLIPERDYETLLSTINLKQYSNTELSALKFFRDYPELMEEYDIHNEYELHNLLRKIWPPEETSVEFKKMPTIHVGKPDRDTQILDLLLEYAPISVDDLAAKYEDAYGAKAATFKGSYLDNFDEYLFDGVYSIQADNLPPKQFDRMKAALKDDFYWISQIKEIYKREFPDADEKQINPYTLKTLGFMVLTDYVVSGKYSSATEYFNKLLSTDLFDIDAFPAGILSLPTFTQVLYEKKAARTIVEYAPHKYMSMAKLSPFGVTPDSIQAYCERVYDFAKGKAFYTVASLRNDGFSHKLADETFDDWFYSSLLTEDRQRFSFQRIGRTKLFTNGTAGVSIADLLEWTIKQNGRMTYAAVNKLFETRYEIFISKDKMLRIADEASLFFDQIESTFYSSYQDYREK